MTFKKDKYVVIRQAISKELAAFVANYFSMKKQVMDTCRQARFISPFETLLGEYEGAEGQIPYTYSSYSDIAMETLMLKCQPIMEKTTGLKLNPAYTFARIYKNGDVLKRHKDRFSCEISTTMNLAGDPWPIYLEPSGKLNKKGIEINLQQGEALLYAGCKVEHWREEFQGENCGQVFLHYNTLKVAQKNNNLFDSRLHLGLPSCFRK